MNDDLISREVLKKAITEKLGIYLDGTLNNRLLFGIIDNAPSVETDIEVVAKDAYEQGYTDGWKERFGEPEERSQGEWITDNLHNTICNRCGGIRRDNRVDYIAFCNKCGADMRKGEQ